MQTKTPKLRSGSRRCLVPFKPVVPLLAFFMAMVAVGLGTVQMQAANAGPSFAKDILPILAESCFQCHGPDEVARKGTQPLDLPEGTQAVITPGQPDASKLMQRVTARDPSKRMPPTSFGQRLSDSEQQKLALWISTKSGKVVTKAVLSIKILNIF